MSVKLDEVCVIHGLRNNTQYNGLIVVPYEWVTENNVALVKFSDEQLRLHNTRKQMMREKTLCQKTNTVKIACANLCAARVALQNMGHVDAELAKLRATHGSLVDDMLAASNTEFI